MAVVAVADALGMENCFPAVLGFTGIVRGGWYSLQRHYGGFLPVGFATAGIHTRKKAVIKSISVSGDSFVFDSHLALDLLELDGWQAIFDQKIL